MVTSDEAGHDDSVTDLRPALKLFTDRREAIRLFSEYLNDDPPRERVLFFYGDGGNGKTLLLNYLREHYCKRLSRENWEYVKAASDEEFCEHVEKAEGAEVVPSSLVDFGGAVKDYRPLDAFSALSTMRRALAGQGLRFPLFDFACVWYLHRTGNLTDEKRRSLFPPEETDLAAEIVNAVGSTSWGTVAKVFLNIFSKHSRDWFTLYRQRRQLDEERVQAIQRMDPEQELAARLPYLFAEDLNAAVALDDARRRVVLFFDTHEAFWGTEKPNLSRDRFFYRDEWLRGLILTLNRAAGVIVALAGRDRPRWAEASKVKISDELLDAQLIGHLSEADAALYLERAGVLDDEMQQALIACARVAPGQVHPFYLGLCVDIVAAAAKKGTPLAPKAFRSVPQAVDKENELVDRLLRYVDEEIHYAIRALSACRAFNRETYFKLGGALWFHATEPSFQILTRFSFVWPTTRRGDGWYRVHDLLRRLMRERRDDVLGRADAVLEKHYRERGDAGGVAEAIYHANQLDPARGVEEWSEVFRNAFKSGRVELCQALLGVRNELVIKTEFDRGLVSAEEGEYYLTMARYDEARQELLEAIASYDAASRLEPDLPNIHNNKGMALAALGELYNQLSLYEEAEASYERALVSLDEAIRLGLNSGQAHANKGLAFQALGRLQTLQSKSEKAEASYRGALASFDAALLLLADSSDIHVGKGGALCSLGHALAVRSRYEEALASYEQAIASLDEAVRLASDSRIAHYIKGVTLQAIGELHFQRSRQEEAIVSHREALASFDEALRLAPDVAFVHVSKGMTLRGLGDAQTQLSRHEEAVRCFEEALASFDSALRLAPDMVDIHLNKGHTLRSFAAAHALQSNYEEAAVRCEEALASFDAALRLAPETVIAHINKGATLQSLGDIRNSQSRHEEALVSFEEALVCLDAALRISPDLAHIHANKGFTLRGLGQTQGQLSRFEDAAATLKEAIASFDTALRLAPDFAWAHAFRGATLHLLGAVQADVQQPEAAMESCRAALSAFSRSLEIAEGSPWVQEMKDSAQELLDDLTKS